MSKKNTLTALDIAPFLGCDMYRFGTPDEKLLGITLDHPNVLLHYADGDEFSFPEDNIVHRPILRPLSDMTPDEGKEFGLSRYFHGEKCQLGSIKEMIFAYKVPMLCAKHFDVFGWIELGLAIDKTTYYAEK